MRGNATAFTGFNNTEQWVAALVVHHDLCSLHHGFHFKVTWSKVMFLFDDLGYGDLSCYGRPDYKTPVLDAFAKQGITFTDNYAAAPVCTPTRCASNRCSTTCSRMR